MSSHYRLYPSEKPDVMGKKERLYLQAHEKNINKR